MRGSTAPATLGLLAAAVLATTPVAAQEFGVYLMCSGEAQARGRTLQASLDLALRRNSALALIERSNVLPVGEKMKLEITPAHYSMVFRAPVRGSAAFYDWIRGALVVWSPELQQLHTVRLSVDRQTAALEGEMRDGANALIGRLQMHCEPRNNDTVAPPKF